MVMLGWVMFVRCWLVVFIASKRFPNPVTSSPIAAIRVSMVDR